MAAGPLTIITGALFSALSGPDSSPPSNGTNATVWDTTYKGTASFMSLSPDTTPTSPNPSHFYYNNDTSTFTGCDNNTFSSTDNVVFMNPLQFGDISSKNSTCGDWIRIKNRENTYDTTYAKIVGICDDCDYGCVATNLATLNSLAPDLPFDEMVFDPNSNLTIGNLTDPVDPLTESTPIQPYDLVNISWLLSDPPEEPLPSPSPTPTTTASTTTAKATTITTTKATTTTAKATTTTSTTTSSAKTKSPSPTTSRSKSSSTPSPTSPPTTGKKYTGRGTWYSDTYGQCEHSYSQSDMIVAVNQAQMGTGTKLCGQKLLVTAEGSSAQVIVTVVDMCPSAYCSSGDLDLSQAAFKKFAKLSVGVLKLSWKFVSN
ncbi:hypothetical protein BGX21_010387 [Mortierella sp. AD011]|nr:hypothetical protein BGX20_010608 [Mortierella sp. AD010]KAF9402345.1 hypothetical protein BGX21_010387 [Mortierella sp. AD011]